MPPRKENCTILMPNYSVIFQQIANDFLQILRANYILFRVIPLLLFILRRQKNDFYSHFLFFIDTKFLFLL